MFSCNFKWNLKILATISTKPTAFFLFYFLSLFSMSGTFGILTSFYTPFVLADDNTVVYLQSQSTQLRQAPQSTSPAIQEIKRGETLTILKKEGLWLQVKTSSQTEGWVPKILTSSVKPLGSAQLLKDTSSLDSNAKTSRRRTTDYAVSAATRGLASSERHRPGDENFRSNRQAVEELEKIKITPEQLKKFKEEAQLIGP